MKTRISRVTERRRSAINTISNNPKSYQDDKVARAKEEFALACVALRDAQHRLALACVKAHPFTWSPQIDEAIPELSRAMIALRAVERPGSRGRRGAQ